MLLSVKNEPDCSPLDDSLTNIQWLGRMNTQVSGVEPENKESNKENLEVQFKSCCMSFTPDDVANKPINGSLLKESTNFD